MGVYACRAKLTCNVDVGWGGVQGGRCPCSAAVAGGDTLNGEDDIPQSRIIYPIY